MSSLERPTPSINDLPDEILFMIFSYHSFEAIHEFAKVSTRWRVVAHNPNLITRIVYTADSNCTYEVVRETLLRAKNLKYLYLDYADEFEEVLDIVMTQCTGLEELLLKRLNSSFGQLPLLSKNLPNLKALTIKFVTMPYDDPAVWDFKNLKTLVLANSDPISNDTVDDITHYLKELTYLNLHWITTITDPSIFKITSIYKDTLTQLCFDGRNVSTSAFVTLKHCIHLERISVPGCVHITNAGLKALRDMKHLKRVKLNESQYFTPRALRKFFKTGNHSNITELNLSRCLNLNDKVMKIISRECPKITILKIHFCDKVTDASIQRILRRCPNLAVLGLISILEDMDYTNLYNQNGKKILVEKAFPY